MTSSIKTNNVIWQIWIDTGGTFTDCLAISPDRQQHTAKVLSSSRLRAKIVAQISPNTFKIAHTWEIKHPQLLERYGFQLLQKEHKTSIVTHFNANENTLQVSQNITASIGQNFELQSPEEAPILAARLVTQTPLLQSLPPIQMRLGSTKGTNALLERTGAKVALFTTKGFADLLEIGNQQRPDLFALHIQKATQLYNTVIEVPERLAANGSILQSIDLSSIEGKINDLQKQGIDSVAIALLHSYKNPLHELQLAEYLRHQGFQNISYSSKLSPLIKIVPRASTAVVNAYLEPIIQRYLEKVQKPLITQTTEVSETSVVSNLHIMTSAGGLVKSQQFTPKDSLLSGPAGGVVGATKIGQSVGFDQLITFDMGGTSTDVARFNGQYDYQFEQKVGDAHLFAPALAIETVAAGGGSICSFDGFRLKVGPESGGANPGPACYGSGGALTITDVNLLLGRLDENAFGIPIQIEAAERQLQQIQEAIAKKQGAKPSKTAILQAFTTIANEKMADAIRKISVQKGYDAKEYALVAFGGAGGQHACELAELLEMETVIVPHQAGILSAYGMGQAAIERFVEKQILQSLENFAGKMKNVLKELGEDAMGVLKEEGLDAEVRQCLLYLRLKGQESTLEIDGKMLVENGLKEEKNVLQELQRAFEEKYRQVYGHWVEKKNVAIEVESVRVIATSFLFPPKQEYYNEVLSSKKELLVEEKTILEDDYKKMNTKKVCFNGEWVETSIFHFNELPPHAKIEGTALVLYDHSTLLIPPYWTFQVETSKTGVLTYDGRQQEFGGSEESITSEYLHTQASKNFNSSILQHFNTNKSLKLELFTNRFKAIANEMGAMLQRTAMSVNVKERLDFSCALLDQEGFLVVNAPHIPVHLGSLGICVRSLVPFMEMEEGDTVVTNHPAFGGSHLPDVTLVSPVFSTKGKGLLGYVANRAHHAEIGGTRPGSMPPDARTLGEEGVVIEPTYLVKKWTAKWAEIRNILGGATYPSRAIDENMADLRAALAANQRGIQALQELEEKFGADEVAFFMEELKNHARQVTQNALAAYGSGVYEAVEYLDDGAAIAVKITLKEDKSDKHHIDFSGTGKVQAGNLNANPAIVNSALMYVLRLLIREDLPLNEGIMSDIEVHLPENCLLNPTFSENPKSCPAVVGGNTEVSQRLTDTLLKAFGLAACSQGTMNNLLFGNESFGYYETICGGSGAVDGFEGASAVHTHMTNTRITDPEIMEHRYPVRLEHFAIRKGSGGKGLYGGGDGVIRQIRFLAPVALSVLTQHRKSSPYGLQGGENGAVGLQYVIRKNGDIVELDSVDGCDLEVDDVVVMETPGGGGFGMFDGER
ncbi:MAG: hydantoinase B/oxoprolinase family protein [Chitinophagales bacterium]